MDCWGEQPHYHVPVSVLGGNVDGDKGQRLWVFYWIVQLPHNQRRFHRSHIRLGLVHSWILTGSVYHRGDWGVVEIDWTARVVAFRLPALTILPLQPRRSVETMSD